MSACTGTDAIRKPTALLEAADGASVHEQGAACSEAAGDGNASVDRNGRGGGSSFVAIGVGAGAVIGAVLGAAGIASAVGIAGAALWLLARPWSDTPSAVSYASCTRKDDSLMAEKP